MANKKVSGGAAQQNVESQESEKKYVRNRGTGKIELLINGEIVVFPPKSTIEVPIDFDVPNGIGLYVK